MPARAWRGALAPATRAVASRNAGGSFP